MQIKTAKNQGPTSQTCELQDFYLSAFLICSGLDLIRTDPAENNRKIFVLRESPDRSRLTEAYYGHRASVDPLAFKDTIVNLKSIIHGRTPIR